MSSPSIWSSPSPSPIPTQSKFHAYAQPLVYPPARRHFDNHYNTLKSSLIEPSIVHLEPHP